MWKPDDVEWSDIEIAGDASDQRVALDLTDKSFVELSGLTFSFFEEMLKETYPTSRSSEHINVNNCHFHSAVNSVWLVRRLDRSKPHKKTRFWSVTANEFSHIDDNIIFSTPFFTEGNKNERGRDPANGKRDSTQ